MVADPTKTVFALWNDADLSPEELRRLLVDEVVPDLLDGPVTWASVTVRDEEAAQVSAPTPFPLGVDKPAALLNLWSSDPGLVDVVLARLEPLGLRAHAWVSEASIYTDYGGNRHSGPRYWPDGQRSPGVTAVSFLTRPPAIPLDEWVRRWHGRMSPVSEEIQPRTRYVRNLLIAPMTAGAPPFQAIVEEAWPSPRHVRNPFLFYGAGYNPFKLVWNMVRLLAAVASFVKVPQVQTVMMSEWFLRTPWGEDA